MRSCLKDDWAVRLRGDLAPASSIAGRGSAGRGLAKKALGHGSTPASTLSTGPPHRRAAALATGRAAALAADRAASSLAVARAAASLAAPRAGTSALSTAPCNSEATLSDSIASFSIGPRALLHNHRRRWHELSNNSRTTAPPARPITMTSPSNSVRPLIGGSTEAAVEGDGRGSRGGCGGRGGEGGGEGGGGEGGGGDGGADGGGGEGGGEGGSCVLRQGATSSNSCHVVRQSVLAAVPWSLSGRRRRPPTGARCCDVKRASNAQLRTCVLHGVTTACGANLN